MRGLQDAFRKLEDDLIGTGLVNNVELSRPDDFLKKKKNFYPAVHIDYETGSLTDFTATVNMEVIIVDQVDEEIDGHENKVLSSTLTIASRLVAILQKADPQELFHLNEDATFTRVYEQGAQNYAGHVLSFPLVIQNESHENG